MQTVMRDTEREREPQAALHMKILKCTKYDTLNPIHNKTEKASAAYLEMAAKKGHVVERIVGERAKEMVKEISAGKKEAEFEGFVKRVVLSEDDVIAITEAMRQSTSMTQIILTSGRITDVGAAEIAEAIKANKSLQMLNLNRNQITGAGAIALAGAIKDNMIMILTFSDNQFADSGATALSEALRMNKGLIALNLERNNIGDAGGIALAEIVRTNKLMQFLMLEENQISDAGAIALADAMKVNKTLEVLSLGGNRITNKGAIALAEALMGNTTLMSLCLDGQEGITNEAVPAMKALLKSSFIGDLGGEGEDPLRGTSISPEARSELGNLIDIPEKKREIPFKAPKKKYSAFIARHPHDTVFDDVAMKIKNTLSDGGEVYVDGGKHQHLNISQLLHEVEDSETVLWLLLNEDVISLPVSLIELNHAFVNGIPIVIAIDKNSFNMDKAFEFMKQLEKRLKEPALELMKWNDLDAKEVGMNLVRMLVSATRTTVIKPIDIKGDLQKEVEKIAKRIRGSGPGEKGLQGASSSSVNADADDTDSDDDEYS